jgi:hypothetical protein
MLPRAVTGITLFFYFNSDHFKNLVVEENAWLSPLVPVTMELFFYVFLTRKYFNSEYQKAYPPSLQKRAYVRSFEVTHPGSTVY